MVFASYGLSWERESYARRRWVPASTQVQVASKALHDANDALLGVHCIALPHQAPGSPSQNVPLSSLHSLKKLKPSLSAGFRKMFYYASNYFACP